MGKTSGLMGCIKTCNKDVTWVENLYGSMACLPLKKFKLAVLSHDHFLTLLPEFSVKCLPEFTSNKFNCTNFNLFANWVKINVHEFYEKCQKMLTW